MALKAVSLDDKYARSQGTVYLTGTQALVRLMMMQRERDAAAGLDTAGFVSGYRGSPLGSLDQQLWQAKPFLDRHRIHFQPGVNEDLAATAVWGSQQGDIFKDFRHDGVFALWYGKGPGVDRCGDVFRHGNGAGSARQGGVLLVAGDDHTAKSSTTAHQCEFAFMDALIPVLAPSSVQEILELGLHGWAMSRASGCWVGFKAVSEIVDTSATVSIDPARTRIAVPGELTGAGPDLHIRFPDSPPEQEARLHRLKLPAALAYARANGLDRIAIDSRAPRLGIITAGKSYPDVLQALELLGIDRDMADRLGLRLYKVGMSWPLEPHGLRRFAEGLQQLLVVEEKRGVLEGQIKDQLYNWHADLRPRIIGKTDERGRPLLPSHGELRPETIAATIARWLGALDGDRDLERQAARLDEMEAGVRRAAVQTRRPAYFCSGCPHNTSTKVPEGSRALAGIGCHYLVQWMDRDTETFTQMGGEGAPWIGQAPFSTTEHVFVNLGDGTYYHSGVMAVRACVAAGVNVTFKLLYNDAVAMTGGQPFDGPLEPTAITRQLAAEGVRRIVVVTDEPQKYPLGAAWAPDVTIEHRDHLDRVQRDLRETPGVTVLLYDQTCAAEKRRRRKRGLFPDPKKRAFINEAVCEGCGDCSRQSNCLSIVPVETDFGRKRRVDQSSCNKDFSCVKGFCPSFVTVHGGSLRRGGDGEAADAGVALPEPSPPTPEGAYGILVAGIGGTGVVTIGALLAMAAHIEGKAASVLDMLGLSQKGGAVTSHVRIGPRPDDLSAARIPAGRADLVIGCDLVTAAGPDALRLMHPGRTRAVVNSHESITGDFTRNPDFSLPAVALQTQITEAAGDGRTDALDATRLAIRLMGDAIYTNLLILGFAWQRGLLPIGRAALHRAIELNGTAVEANRRAFEWGRRIAADPELARRLDSAGADGRREGQSLEAIVEERARILADYQDEAYAGRYRALLDRVRRSESDKTPGMSGLTETVARSYFKLLAIKDEYEVARLFVQPAFRQALESQFEGNYKLSFHLAPPLLARPDPETGEIRKREYGPWIFPVFKVLAKLKGLRGTRFDIFGMSTERRRERALVREFEALIEELLSGLTHERHSLAVDLAALPEGIRGFGPVKEASIDVAKSREKELLAHFRHAPSHCSAAE